GEESAYAGNDTRERAELADVADRDLSHRERPLVSPGEAEVLGGLLRYLGAAEDEVPLPQVEVGLEQEGVRVVSMLVVHPPDGGRGPDPAVSERAVVDRGGGVAVDGGGRLPIRVCLRIFEMPTGDL